MEFKSTRLIQKKTRSKKEEEKGRIKRKVIVKWYI